MKLFLNNWSNFSNFPKFLASLGRVSFLLELERIRGHSFQVLTLLTVNRHWEGVLKLILRRKRESNVIVTRSFFSAVIYLNSLFLLSIFSYYLWLYFLGRFFFLSSFFSSALFSFFSRFYAKTYFSIIFHINSKLTVLFPCLIFSYFHLGKVDHAHAYVLCKLKTDWFIDIFTDLFIDIFQTYLLTEKEQSKLYE